LSGQRYIDSHQHFWHIARRDYAWMTPEKESIARDFMPDDLRPHLDAAGIHHTVTVQAAATAAETDFILDIAAGTDMVAGVVGWVDMESPAASDMIADLAARPKLCGIRPIIHDIPDDDWMLQEILTPAYRATVEHGLTFDALVFPKHLKNLLTILDRHPDLRCVVDHCAKPHVRDGAFDDWAADMATVASETAALCKLSGLATEAAPGWNADTVRPYIEHLIECFGPERMMWGSDWPVVTLAGTYAEWREASVQVLATLDQAARDAIFGGTAIRFYGLEETIG